jgi:hypothetical protein
MIAGPPLVQDGRLAHRHIRAHHAGEGIEAGFIDEEDPLLLGLRPLLIAGHVSSRQRASAASSRLRARVIHWLTAPSLTPNAWAICRWDQPCRWRFQACSRRASGQL